MLGQQGSLYEADGGDEGARREGRKEDASSPKRTTWSSSLPEPLEFVRLKSMVLEDDC